MKRCLTPGRVTVLVGWYSTAGAITVLAAAAAMVETLAVLQWRSW